MTNSANPAQTVETNNNAIPETKKGFIDKKVLMGIGGLVVTMLGFATVYFGTGERKGDAATIENTPTATEQMAPANTSANTVEVGNTAENTLIAVQEKIPTIDEIENDASLINNPQDIIDKFDKEVHLAWMHAGATPENALADYQARNGADYAEKIANETDQAFIDKVLVKDWQQNPTLVRWVENMKLLHKVTLMRYFVTSPPNSTDPDLKYVDTGDNAHHGKNEIPYVRSFEYSGITELNHTENKSMTIRVTIVDKDNSPLNRIGNSKDYTPVPSEEYSPTTTYTVEDGHIKISGMIFAK